MKWDFLCAVVSLDGRVVGEWKSQDIPEGSGDWIGDFPCRHVGRRVSELSA